MQIINIIKSIYDISTHRLLKPHDKKQQYRIWSIHKQRRLWKSAALSIPFNCWREDYLEVYWHRLRSIKCYSPFVWIVNIKLLSPVLRCILFSSWDLNKTITLSISLSRFFCPSYFKKIKIRPLKFNLFTLPRSWSRCIKFWN